MLEKPKHTDFRGCLVDFLTRKELKKPQIFGHIYFVTFNRPGVIRGNHYHTKKEEYLGVVLGKVQVDIEDIKTKKRWSFVLDAENTRFTLLQINPNIAHAIKNLSRRAILIAYCSLEYDHKKPDSFKYKVC